METRPGFIVPSDGLEKPGLEPATPGLQGEWGHNHCTTGSFDYYKLRDLVSLYEIDLVLNY